jgi:hypothetical protein
MLSHLLHAPKLPLIFALIAGFVAGLAVDSLGTGRELTVPNATASSKSLVTESLQSHSSASVGGYEIHPDTQPITIEQLRAEAAGAKSFPHARDFFRKHLNIIDRLRVSDTAKMVAEMAASQEEASDQAWALVMEVFADKDPQAAWQFAHSMKPGIARQTAIAAVVFSISLNDPARAMTMLDAIENPDHKRQMRSQAIRALAQKDPWGALELATAKKDTEGNDNTVAELFSIWVKKDPEGAKSATARLTGRAADQASHALMRGLAESDPQAAWKYALTLPSSAKHFRATVINAWSESDPQAALKAALEIPDSDMRPLVVSGAVREWARRDFTEALQYTIGVQDSSMRSDLLREMSMNLSGNRQELFDAVLEYMPPGDRFQQTVKHIFSSWSRENPSEAAAALALLPSSRLMAEAARSVVFQWVQKGNQEEILSWVRRLPEGDARRNSLNSVFSQWSAQDPQKALAALNGLSAPDRANAISSLASGWSRVSPEAVIQWSATLADPNERNDAIRQAILQWAGSAPEAAAQYAERLAENERGQAMKAVVEEWAVKDAEAAANWLSRQPAGPEKDLAITSILDQIAIENPESALSWAGMISNQKSRVHQMESLARDWIKQDAAAARHWISTSHLPLEIRQRLAQ